MSSRTADSNDVGPCTTSSQVTVPSGTRKRITEGSPASCRLSASSGDRRRQRRSYFQAMSVPAAAPLASRSPPEQKQRDALFSSRNRRARARWASMSRDWKKGPSSQVSPSQVSPSRIVRTLSSVERSWSVSSILKMKTPPLRRAKSQLNRAVRAPPTWRNPVGLGAKRTRAAPGVTVREEGVGMTVGLKPIPLRRSKRYFDCPRGLHDVYGESVLEEPPMSHASPHRVKPRPHILLSSVILGLLAFFLAAGPYPVALPSDGRLPGTIGKAPALVAGFPMPFPR